MYFLTKYVAKVITVFYIILYSVNEASCLKCYECTDLLGNEACLNNPQEYRTCGVEVPNKEISTLLSALTKISAAGSEDPHASESYECFAMTGISKESKVIFRSCAPKSLSDKYIKAPVIKLGLEVDDVSRCATDLCNSPDSSDPTNSTPSTDPSSTPTSSSTTSTDPTSTLSPNPSSTPSPNSSSSVSVGFLILAISLLPILFD